MHKRLASIVGLLALSLVLLGTLTAAAPGPDTLPNVTFTLVSGLPLVMNAGDTATVVVQVTSDQEFLLAQMLPTFHFRGLMAVNMGGDRVSRNTSATLEITFIAKGSTTALPDEGVCPTAGVAPVAFVAGVRYAGGFVTAQRFPEAGFYCVAVP